MQYIWHLFNESRIKSFLWRSLGMGVAAMLAYAGENYASLELGPVVTTLAGLFIGELTKAWNNYQRSL